MARKLDVKPSGCSIVVVDDSRELLASTARLLRRDGHEVTAFDEPERALEALRTGPRPDLVLVDYFMPKMTGEAFVIELRRFAPRMQVVLQTGYASEQSPRDLLRCLEVQGYFDKSDGPDKLLLWVDLCLRAAKTIRELEARAPSLCP